MIFMAGLILLQQTIAFSSNHSPHINQQTLLIENQDIDPSALFYMESKLALNAEKSVRKMINEKASARQREISE